MGRVAHKVKYTFEHKEQHGPHTFTRRTYHYACGKSDATIIEAELDEAASDGWPPGTRLCAKCEKAMQK